MDIEFEDSLRRPSPLLPYRTENLKLDVPVNAVTITLELLQRAARRESGLFWYGERDAVGNGLVTYVVAPRQRMTRGNYHVSPQALAEVVNRLPTNWKPLAQVHSHPGISVEHSNYDDRMASSRRVLSLVFPLYGRSQAPFPIGVGIHEYQNNYWYLLNQEDAARRVILINGDVCYEDLR